MAKVPWVKRVYFGTPVQLRRTPVEVTFRRESDNGLVQQWKDFSGSQPSTVTRHENGIIKTFVDPGRYKIAISDGANYFELRDQIVFMDIDQFDEIAGIDVDGENDSIICYDVNNTRYIRVGVNDFFNIAGAVEFPFKNGIVDGITQGIAAVRANRQVTSSGTIDRLPSPNLNVARICRTFSADVALYIDGTFTYYGGVATPPTPTGRINHISGQLNHYFAVQEDGTLLSWGSDSDGQATIPAEADNGNILKAVAANLHSLVLRNDGTVYGWGADSDNLTPVPASIAALNDVIDCHMYAPNAYVLRANGELLTWGAGISGYHTLATNIVEFSGGQGKAIGLTDDGDVRTFGGSFGIEETTNSSSGGIPDGLNEMNIVAVHAIRPTGFVAVHPDGSTTWWNTSEETPDDLLVE